MFHMLIENIALHQPAWQSSTVLPYTGADRAVDGRYSNLSVHGRQCAMSDNNQTTAEWRVDLGRVHSIHHVFLQFMTHNRVWGTVSITITIQLPTVESLLYLTCNSTSIKIGLA